MPKQVLAGKSGKAVNDQYKMDLGKGYPNKLSYKRKVKPFVDAEDTTDEAETADQLQGEDETAETIPKQDTQPTNTHRAMHTMMDKLEADKTTKGLKNRPHGGKTGSAPTNRKKLSMF